MRRQSSSTGLEAHPVPLEARPQGRGVPLPENGRDLIERHLERAQQADRSASVACAAE